MKRRALIVTAVSGCVIMATATFARADWSRSDSKTFRGGAGSLTVSWVYGCGAIGHEPPPNQEVALYHPHWNLRADETGQTGWKKVKFAYKHRQDGDTFIEQQVVGDISARNAVFDPPKYAPGVATVDTSH